MADPVSCFLDQLWISLLNIKFSVLIADILFKYYMSLKFLNKLNSCCRATFLATITVGLNTFAVFGAFVHPDLGSSVTLVADDPRPSKEGQSPSRKQSNKVTKHKLLPIRCNTRQTTINIVQFITEIFSCVFSANELLIFVMFIDGYK